MKAVARRR